MQGRSCGTNRLSTLEHERKPQGLSILNGQALWPISLAAVDRAGHLAARLSARPGTDAIGKTGPLRVKEVKREMNLLGKPNVS